MQRAVLNSALAAALALPVEIPLAAVSPDPQTPDQWLDDDAEQRAAAVNLGRLTFLSLPPKKTVLHQYQTITIGRHSLRDGWVRLNQCFEHLDPVPLAQVVYNATRTRSLKIDSFSGIAKAWVEGASVQLADIRRGAKLCVEAENRSLLRNDDGSYSLRSGPFMRNFLDGYYPMRVTMQVNTRGLLRYVGITPRPQAGFRVWQTTAEVHCEAWFEGKLFTEIRFRPRAPR